MAKALARPRAFKVGDIVRIVKPEFVLRVGYPLTWSMLTEEIGGDPQKLFQAIEACNVELVKAVS